MSDVSATPEMLAKVRAKVMEHQNELRGHPHDIQMAVAGYMKKFGYEFFDLPREARVLIARFMAETHALAEEVLDAAIAAHEAKQAKKAE